MTVCLIRNATNENRLRDWRTRWGGGPGRRRGRGSRGWVASSSREGGSGGGERSKREEAEHLDPRAATCPFSCRFPHHLPLVSHSDPAPFSRRSAPKPRSHNMPTCRRKRVVLTEPSEALLQALKSDPARQVFYLEQTGEIFETFEYVLLRPLSRPRSQTPAYQSICRSHVFLPSQAVSMRGHGQEWS